MGLREFIPDVLMRGLPDGLMPARAPAPSLVELRSATGGLTEVPISDAARYVAGSDAAEAVRILEQGKPIAFHGFVGSDDPGFGNLHGRLPLITLMTDDGAAMASVIKADHAQAAEEIFAYQTATALHLDDVVAPVGAGPAGEARIAYVTGSDLNQLNITTAVSLRGHLIDARLTARGLTVKAATADDLRDAIQLADMSMQRMTALDAVLGHDDRNLGNAVIDARSGRLQLFDFGMIGRGDMRSGNPRLPDLKVDLHHGTHSGESFAAPDAKRSMKVLRLDVPYVAGSMPVDAAEAIRASHAELAAAPIADGPGLLWSRNADEYVRTERYLENVLERSSRINETGQVAFSRRVVRNEYG